MDDSGGWDSSYQSDADAISQDPESAAREAAAYSGYQSDADQISQNKITADLAAAGFGSGFGSLSSFGDLTYGQLTQEDREAFDRAYNNYLSLQIDEDRDRAIQNAVTAGLSKISGNYAAGFDPAASDAAMAEAFASAPNDPNGPNANLGYGYADQSFYESLALAPLDDSPVNTLVPAPLTPVQEELLIAGAIIGAPPAVFTPEILTDPVVTNSFLGIPTEGTDSYGNTYTPGFSLSFNPTQSPYGNALVNVGNAVSIVTANPLGAIAGRAIDSVLDLGSSIGVNTTWTPSAPSDGSGDFMWSGGSPNFDESLDNGGYSEPSSDTSNGGNFGAGNFSQTAADAPASVDPKTAAAAKSSGFDFGPIILGIATALLFGA